MYRYVTVVVIAVAAIHIRWLVTTDWWQYATTDAADSI